VDLITLATPPGPSRTTAHRDHGVRVMSRREGAITRDVRVGSCGTDDGPEWLSEAIVGLDYAARTVDLPWQEGYQEAFAPGRAVRVFNADRTAVFRIEDVKRVGEVLRLTLNHTALLARGPVAELRDGALDVGAYFVYSTGHDDEATGDLVESNSLYFRGAWLGEGADACSLRGTARLSDAATRVYVDQALSADELERRFGGEVVSVWQYGIGDTLELAVVR
jgi:hypothetical protein